MTAKKSILIPVLALSTLIASALALYFGVQVDALQNELNKRSTQEDTGLNTPNKAAIAKVDSLLFQGDYQAASQLAKELNQAQRFSDDSPLKTRYQMANSLLTLGKKNQRLQNRFDENNAELDSLGMETQEDSLVNLLKETRVEMANLKQRLRKNPESDYLSFKTSKGTLLHYVGAVKDSKANGFGIALLETGSRYEGQWKNNQRHGYGKFFWDDGEHYEGEYRDDKREGTGTYFWDNGEKYVGEWKDDRRNGEGNFYNRRGKLKASGIWEDDKLVEEN